MTTPVTRKRTRRGTPGSRSVRRRLFGGVLTTRFSNRVAGAVVVAKGNQPIPTRTRCVMKYSDVLTTGTPAFFAYEFRLNSTFDPDVTGGGHQPYGRDTYATLYSRYRVLSASWVFWFPSVSNTALVNTEPITYVVVPGVGSPTVSSIGQALELPRAQSVTTSVGGSTEKITGRIALNQLAGLSATEYMGQDEFEAGVGSNPVRLLSLDVFGQATDGTAIGVSQPFSFVISYFVEWYDPQQLAQS